MSEQFKAKSPEAYPIARKVAVFAAILPFVVGISGCEDEEKVTVAYETTTAVATPEPTEGLLDEDKVCPEVSEVSIDKVEDVFAASWVYYYSDDSSSESADELLAEREAHRQKVAKELGLTIYERSPELAELAKDLYTEASSIPVETYFQQATELLSRYGVSIVFAGSEEDDTVDTRSGNNSEPYSYETMVTENDIHAKRALYGMAADLEELPLEYVQATGLKRIIFAKSLKGSYKGDDHAVVAGFVDPQLVDEDTVYLSMQASEQSVLRHEMVHLWDIRTCGPYGFQSDQQYNHLNPKPAEGEFLFYANTEGYYSVDQAASETFKGDYYSRLNAATTDEEKALIQAEMDVIDAKVVTQTEYGMTNAVEDKAELGSMVFSKFSRMDMEDTTSPILQDKAALLMTRLYEQDPRLVEFFARADNQSLNKTNVLADE